MPRKEILQNLLDNELGRDADGNFIVRGRGGAAARVGTQGDPFTADAVLAAGAANIALVSITVRDMDGSAIAFPVILDIWLSDSPAGVGLTATTASGAVAAGASGIDLDVGVAKKMMRVQTTAAGLYILSITDAAKTLFRVCAQVAGRPVVVATLITGNYG